jgi:hypothetical protein
VDDLAADVPIDKGRRLFDAGDDHYASMPAVAIHDGDHGELAPWAGARRRSEKMRCAKRQGTQNNA